MIGFRKLVKNYLIWTFFYLFGLFVVWLIREPFFTPDPHDLDIPFAFGLIILTISYIVTWAIFVITNDKKNNDSKSGEKS